VAYCNGFNRRNPRLSVLIVEPRVHLLRATVDRYLRCCSFAMASAPEVAATAANMFAFDGFVLSAHLEPHARDRVVAALGSGAPVLEIDDPLLVTRELRQRTQRFAPLAFAR
jgi:hypothetical protein